MNKDFNLCCASIDEIYSLGYIKARLYHLQNKYIEEKGGYILLSHWPITAVLSHAK